MKYSSLLIIVSCVVMFVLQLSVEGLTDLFLLSEAALIQPWRFVTHMFLHGSFQHLFYNMFALGIFGLILENIIGTEKFLKVYFIGGLLAALVALPFYSASLGASGAIFAVLGCLTYLRPKMMVWVIGVPMPMIVAAAMWVIIDLVGVFYPSGTANLAHLGGIAAGLLFGYLYRRHKQDSQRKYEIDDDRFYVWEENYM